MRTPAVIGACAPRRLADPRLFQVAALGTLLAVGQTTLGIGVDGLHCLLLFAAALGTQALASRWAGLPRTDFLSATITGLSLNLILRTDLAALAFAAGAAAIGSKFLVRVRGKHVFNPANFAIVLLAVSSDRAWISSGQWGSSTLAALAVACIGFVVITRARRIETTLAFLAVYALLLVGRALWLGDPLAIPLHQLQNGALLIFAFFMISDPKTTPDSAAGRLLYGTTVAVVSLPIQFVLFIPGAPLYALFACSPLVPLIDRRFRAPAYAWVPGKSPLGQATLTGDSHALDTCCSIHNRHAPCCTPGQRFLWLLRGKSRHRLVQPGLAGRARARR